MKRNGFNHTIMSSVNTSSETSDLPFTSLDSAPLLLGVTLAHERITTPPLGSFLLLIRSRHARSTEIRVSAFQRTSRQRHLKLERRECCNRKRKGGRSRRLERFFSRESGFSEKQDCVGNTLAVISPSQSACLHIH